MVRGDVFLGNEQINTDLTTHLLNLSDLKLYLLFKYENYKAAGKAAGISSCRVRQIVIGYALPKTAHLIRQLARAWDIDEIKLAQLFEEFRDYSLKPFSQQTSEDYSEGSNLNINQEVKKC